MASEERRSATDSEVVEPQSRKTSKIYRYQEHFDTINERPVDDISLEFFYKPHTITLLTATIVVLIYTAFTRADANREDNIWSGLKALAFFFVVVSSLAFPNGPFTRPHPAVWRIVFGMSVLYLLSLQFILFQSFTDVKALLRWFDPIRLNKSHLDEKEYAINCSDVSFQRVWSHIDIFALSHFVGWALKALLIRHYGICWYISVTWEITEIAFSHLLPNFQECWWDAIILDILLCNGLGIWLGMWICKKLEMRNYHWESIKNIPTATGKLKRAVLQFTPVSWVHVRWLDPNSTIMRFIALGQLVVIWQITELNTFFVKHIFAIDTSHPLVAYRLILVMLVVAPTVRQFYVYVTDPYCKRMGTQCWVYVAMTFSESIVCIKFGRELFAQTQITYIIIWLMILLIGSVFCVYLCIWIAKWSPETMEVKVNGAVRHRFIDSSMENISDPTNEAFLFNPDKSQLRQRPPGIRRQRFNTGPSTTKTMDKAVLVLRAVKGKRFHIGRFVATSGAKSESIKSKNDLGTVRARFAPSPTGFVHIGSLRAIAYNYMFARSHPDGRFILRIEDTDRERIVPGAAEQLESVLEWMGMEADESPLKGGPAGPYVQSQRLEYYREAAKILLEAGEAYRCFCTNDRLMLMRKEALKNRESLRYDNFCRSLSPEQIDNKLSSGTPFALRFILQKEPSSFTDTVFGHFEHPVAEHEGDPVIMKSDGFPTYHFANVVDDHHMRITHVIRGDEWLDSTVKHVQMYAAFGWQPPVFAHVPPMTKGKGKKLSKRDEAANLDMYRKLGYYPLPLINCVLSTAGGFEYEKDKNRLYTIDEMKAIFRLEKLTTRPTAFEPEYLDKYNRLFITEFMSRSDLLSECRKLIASRMDESKMEKTEQESLDDAYLNRIFDQYLDGRIITVVQLIDNPDHAFLWRHNNVLHPDLKKPVTIRQDTIQVKEVVEYLEQLVAEFEEHFAVESTNYDLESLKTFLSDFEKRSGINHRVLFHAIRLLITNTPRGLPITEMFYLLGKDRVIRRLQHGIDQLKSMLEGDQVKEPLRSG